VCTQTRLAQVGECFVHVYSSARLLSALGGYDDTADMARDNHVFAEEGLVNMPGGCCGSTLPHI
jgi:5-methyltetrahydrofolate--homocysteine methyltransferase